jgi:quinol monooxygenase YgiN
MKINLTVVFKSKPEHIEAVRSMLLNLVEKSREEKACLQYDLHQSSGDPGIFIFHEIWESKEGLDLHNEQPYIKQFVADIPALIEEPAALYRTTLLQP